MTCNSCQLLRIQGVVCHETGCPNMHNIRCASCDVEVQRHKIYRANDWDGLEYCRDCAERQAEYEAETETNDFVD